MSEKCIGETARYEKAPKKTVKPKRMPRNEAVSRRADSDPAIAPGDSAIGVTNSASHQNSLVKASLVAVPNITVRLLVDSDIT